MVMLGAVQLILCPAIPVAPAPGHARASRRDLSRLHRRSGFFENVYSTIFYYILLHSHCFISPTLGRSPRSTINEPRPSTFRKKSTLIYPNLLLSTFYHFPLRAIVNLYQCFDPAILKAASLVSPK